MTRIKELRKKKKVTQQEVAEAIGITRRGFQKWENGESQIKSNNAKQLADYFGVSVGYLLGNDEVPKNLIEELELQLDYVLTQTEKEDLENNPELKNHYLSIVRDRLLNNQRKEVEKTAQEFDEDFIRLLKKYSIYLSDNQIEQIKELMKTMSNINNRYLMVAMAGGYFEQMKSEKENEFKELFKYSKIWQENYSTMEYNEKNNIK
ncbi:helix-turn-helix domain-containing protein [Streptococcus mitis]|uniref:HTH-type transcriptional regulator Xre n=1 Tax=Streptococcus mitis TaxID=28037 RepID=A0A428D166_STRMT|nr:helix-turn-helix domain-containing protein [Streptococcus mitis]RSI85878.1 HTH-type transcriptional regulator Xre [Streptococcus mitis]